ncbi:hypothetical protein [Winogradskyella sp. UBA3174]|uniref:hypothetical protein n=1 Tax=Winogradskyella sp. UBA3174 TaxID=1947785 RepID=UPI0025E64F85|nr:hypothetical protein [Winogradskyella sp. UBA3174]|tara:strand:+ start:9081 stop:9599 length:519 start_codon:yes stop_codon:yes gene_type:complete
MKDLQLLTILFFSVITLSCNKDENNDNLPPQQETFEATINGGTYDNYSFTIGAYQITKGTNGNTLSIDIADPNGDMVTLFLNGDGGFSSNTVKPMGGIDSNNFVTYGLIRQSNPQLSYFSSSGNVTITNNREHPTELGHRLISGTFSITATSSDGLNTTSMTGSFIELNYVD